MTSVELGTQIKSAGNPQDKYCEAIQRRMVRAFNAGEITLARRMLTFYEAINEMSPEEFEAEQR